MIGKVIGARTFAFISPPRQYGHLGQLEIVRMCCE